MRRAAGALGVAGSVGEVEDVDFVGREIEEGSPT